MWTWADSNDVGDSVLPPGWNMDLKGAIEKAGKTFGKDAILKNFTSPSWLRIVIRTVAFGMGMDPLSTQMTIGGGSGQRD